MNTIEQIKKVFLESITLSYEIAPEVAASITLSLNTDADKEAFGDLASNAALVLAKALGQKPCEIATEISARFKHPMIERIEIAGPGFINLFLGADAIKQIALELLEDGDQFFMLDTDTPRRHYSVEFVSANPTGPLHLGHGRGGIIGDVLGNVLRFLGHKVTKEFYINDAGSQIQKLGASFKIRCQQVVGESIELPEDAYHGQYLIDLAKGLIKEEGISVLEKPDNFFADYAKNALLERIKTTLASYGITFDVWFSEKSLHQGHAIEEAIQTLTKRGHTYEAEGALWFHSTTFGDDKDRVLKKSAGSYTYAAADVAYLHNKIGRGAEHLILVLGQDHHSYVVRLKGIMAALGYNPDNLDVILYQLVTLKESGESFRMSKRAGKIVSLEDVIETVGTDVARFFYLHRKADAHLDFDIDLALKHTDENPVYYAQYAYVRTGSILEKSAEHPELASITNDDVKGLSGSEKLVLKKIVVLKELLSNIGKNYQTHLLTYYVLELAQLFHKFYNDHRVIDLEHVEQSRARLVMIAQLRMTFELCFKLLEINRPERM